MEPNKAYMLNDIITIEGIGHQTYNKVKFVEVECIRLSNILRSKNKPVLIHIDLKKTTTTEIGGRKAGFELLKAIEFDKIAMYGSNLMLKYIVKLIVAASGKGAKIRVVDTEEEAINWLKS